MLSTLLASFGAIREERLQRQYSLDKIREGTSSPLFRSLSPREQVNFEEQCNLWKSIQLTNCVEKIDTNEVDHNLQSDCLWYVQESQG